MRAETDVIAGGLLLALGLLYGALAVGEGVGTMAETGAGFFPLVVATVLVAASVTVLGQGLRGTPRGEPAAEGPAENAEGPAEDAEGPAEDSAEDDGDVDWWRVAGVLATALLVPAVGATVGMIVTLSVCVVLAARIMGVSRWARAVILGVAFGAATWLLFVRLLYVPLPAGTLGLV